jgi:hypothetical protein
MQILIHKAALSVECAPSWLTPGCRIGLSGLPDGQMAAFARRDSRWRFRRHVRIGTLGDDDGAILRPLVDSGAPLRVRIVDLTFAHLTTDGVPRIAISVWVGSGAPLPMVR